MPGTMRILGITWERVLLTLEVELSPGDQPYFCLRHIEIPDRTFAISDVGSVGDNRFRLTVNVTAFNARQQIPNGTYELICRPHEPNDQGSLLVGRYPLHRAQGLEDLSRVFFFDDHRSVYAVSFSIRSDETNPDLLIHSYAFSRTDDAATWPQRLASQARRFWRASKRATLHSARRLAHATRRPGRRVVLFASEQSNTLQGNLLAVRDRMIERGLDREFDFVYSLRTENSSNRRNALTLAKAIGRANIVLIDNYFSALTSLGDQKSQRIIQLWHAGSGFKSVGFSRFGQHESPALADSHRNYTYAICGSERLRDVYSEAFGMERESVIATGLPRIDAFLREDRPTEVMRVLSEAFPTITHKRRILFAPTFRGQAATDAYYDYGPIDFDQLHQACGDDTVILFRQHYYLSDPAPIPSSYTDRLIDVSSFLEGNDLLLISDALITDYSSIIYEYSLLRRPIIFYVPDLERYTALRGMHQNFVATAPGAIATTFGELLELITHPYANEGKFSKAKVEKFVHENFDFVDTHNSDRVIDWLILGEPNDMEEVTKA